MLYTTIAENLSNFIYNLQYHDLPENVITKGKLSILDNLGVIIGAWKEKNVLITIEVIRQFGGNPDSTILVYNDKVPIFQAAFCHGIMGHSLELDDHISHKHSLNHPGVVSVPPALAIGENRNINGKTFLLSIIIGYEITCRINRAVPPGFFNFNRGFHGTGICGTFGAAALSGKILKMEPNQIATAIGIAGSFSSGLLEYKSNGSWTKRLHAGNSSKNGILAAILAEKGFTGPLSVFEGKYGFFKAFAGESNYNLELIKKDLGDEYEIQYIQYKPFACSGVVQSPLTAIKKIKEEHRIEPGQIKRVQIFTSTKMVKDFAEPREKKMFPKTNVDAQFSLLYLAAVMICKGNILPHACMESIKDPEILKITPKIECLADQQIDKQWPKNEPSKVIIYLQNGKKIEKSVEAAKGSLEDPLTEEEIKNKFRLLTEKIIEKKAIEKIIEICMNIEKLDNIKDLIKTIQNGVIKSQI